MKKKIDLSLIDQIVDGNTGEETESNSIYAFCARLTNVVPEAAPAFQKTLEAQALAALENKRRTPSPKQSEKLARRIANLGRLPMKKKFVLVIISALFAAMLTLALVPGLGWYMFETIKSVKLGEYTVAEQISLIRTGDPYAISDNWSVQTDIGNFGANLPPLTPAEIQTVTTIDEAQELVNFHIPTPGYLPEGYALKEILVTPEYAQSVFLYYQGPAHDIIIVLMSVGMKINDQPEGSANEMSGSITSVMTGTLGDEPVLETELDGKPAVWVDEHTLMWQGEYAAFFVGGLDLDLETAKQIAGSLQ